MHKQVLFLCAPLMALTACQSTNNPKNEKEHVEARGAGLGPSTAFIPLDSANRMISSYVQSLNNSVQPANLYSVSFDAAKLRAYLADTSITGVKISFAHTLSYINQGQFGNAAGYRSDALTLIVSGYTAAGKFVYHGNQVMDFGAQCPTVCPPGEASSTLFPATTTVSE